MWSVDAFFLQKRTADTPIWPLLSRCYREFVLQISECMTSSSSCVCDLVTGMFSTLTAAIRMTLSYILVAEDSFI